MRVAILVLIALMAVTVFAEVKAQLAGDAFTEAVRTIEKTIGVWREREQ